MSRRGTLARFGFVTLVFGSSFPAVEVGLETLPPLSFAAARYAVSATVLLSYALIAGLALVPRNRADALALVAGGVFLVGGTGFTFLGQQTTTAGVTAILVSLSPVLTVLLGWVLLPDERPGRRGVVGVALGLVGVAIVVNPTGAGSADGSALSGRLLVLVATLSVTLGTVLLRRASSALPGPSLVGWSMAVGSGVLATGATVRGEALAPGAVTPVAAAVVAYLGVVAGAGGFLLYFGLIDAVGPLSANLVTYLVPVVSLSIGWAALDEPVRPAALVGFLVIVAGFVLLSDRALAAELARYRGAGR